MCGRGGRQNPRRHVFCVGVVAPTGAGQGALGACVDDDGKLDGCGGICLVRVGILLSRSQENVFSHHVLRAPLPQRKARKKRQHWTLHTVVVGQSVPSVRAERRIVGVQLGYSADRASMESRWSRCHLGIYPCREPSCLCSVVGVCEGRAQGGTSKAKRCYVLLFLVRPVKALCITNARRIYPPPLCDALLVRPFGGAARFF